MIIISEGGFLTSKENNFRWFHLEIDPYPGEAYLTPFRVHEEHERAERVARPGVE